ncbi:MAG: hypothetical protein JO353_08580 [Phycisphaerae bacterium]|nr:hypothetical protein [Phycisphaerae bacterium]
MKKLLIAALAVIPAMLLLTAVAGASIFTLLHLDVHRRDMEMALLVCFVSAEASLVPLWLTLGTTQLTVSQAGLASTAIHLLLTAFFGLSASVSLHLAQPFLMWLLAFYWLSLIIVAVTAARMLRAAPIVAPHDAPPSNHRDVRAPVS